MPKDFAIIETGGKQYRVSSGESFKFEKLASADGAIVFDKVLLRSVNGEVEIGAPYITGATVEAKLIADGRSKKVIVFKYHSKTRQHKKKGHRQEFTQVEIK